MANNKLETIIMNNLDAETFMEAVDDCKGNVYLITEEGDRLNLKSKFCQLIGLVNIIQGGHLKDAVISCDNLEDESKLFKLNLYGSTDNQ